PTDVSAVNPLASALLTSGGQISPRSRRNWLAGTEVDHKVWSSTGTSCVFRASASAEEKMRRRSAGITWKYRSHCSSRFNDPSTDDFHCQGGTAFTWTATR